MKTGYICPLEAGFVACSQPEIFKVGGKINSNFPGYIFMLRSPIRTTNQIRRSYKNDEFDWPFDFVTVT